MGHYCCPKTCEQVRQSRVVEAQSLHLFHARTPLPEHTHTSRKRHMLVSASATSATSCSPAPSDYSTLNLGLWVDLFISNLSTSCVCLFV